MNAQIPTLFLILAALIGVFIGLLIASLFSGKESQQKKQPPKEVVKEGFAEVARLWYTPAGKRVLTEMDGGFYKEFNSLSKEQQAKVLRLIELLKNYAGGESELQPAAQPISTAREPIVKEPVVEELETEEGVYSSPDKAVSPFKDSDEEDEDVVSTLQYSLGVDEEILQENEPVLSANLSIAQQISAILEEMLEGTDLKDKGIKLIENEENGVDVWIGLDKFPGIDSVPYPQVRQLIHDAVVRWEQETEAQQHMGG
jgi:hypothetical protein